MIEWKMIVIGRKKMTERRQKKAPLPSVYGKDGREEMRRNFIREKMVAVTKTKGVCPYLLLDDRIYCDYKVKSTKLRPTLSTVIWTGYVRGYDAITQTLFVSPFTDSTEMGIASVTKAKTSYMPWKLSNIITLYIEKEVEERIATKIKQRIAERKLKRSLSADTLLH
jgi:hypothetical protein